MSSTLLLDLPEQGNTRSVDVDDAPINATVINVSLTDCSDAIIDAWREDKTRPDDAAAQVFQSRLSDALMTGFSDRFRKLRSGYEPRSIYRGFNSSSINLPSLAVLASEGLHLLPMDMKLTLEKGPVGPLAIPQRDFRLHDTWQDGQRSAMSGWTRQLKTVSHLRLSTYGVHLAPSLFVGARDALLKVPMRARLCPVFGGSLAVGEMDAEVVLFLDVATGDLYRCTCASRAYDDAAKEASNGLKVENYGTAYVDVRELLHKAAPLDEICHRCVLTRQGVEAANAAYGREFTEHVGAYGLLNALDHGTSMRTGTERFLKDMGLSKWKGEADLYELLLTIFPNDRIEREASPLWLARQRFDFYLPERRLALEYNGKQHYEAVDFFGGVEALTRRQTMDEAKRKVAVANGVRVVTVRYDEPLTRAYLLRRLAAVLD